MPSPLVGEGVRRSPQGEDGRKGGKSPLTRRARGALRATLSLKGPSEFYVVWTLEAAACSAASARARLRSISFTHQMETSYRPTSGNARLSWLNTSGGVTIAATANTPT